MSDSPVRRCNAECYFFEHGGKGCQYYQKKDVHFGQACLFEIAKVKEYAEAMRTGDTSVVKNDAAEINAHIVNLILQMIQKVNADGVSIQEPILDIRGSLVYIPHPNGEKGPDGLVRNIPAMRTKDHPLINRAIQLAKSIGMSLNEFKMTPKSADEKASISGRLIVDEQTDINKVLAKRKQDEDRFLNALEKGNQDTKDDPVYQELLERGDIVE